MLTEERYSIILERVKQNKSVKLLELCELLKASESTILRDLTLLDERGLLKKSSWWCHICRGTFFQSGGTGR